MANTYTQIYIHVVFAVEGRQNLIPPEHNVELQKFITGIVSGQKQKLIAINNMPDHLHLLVGLRPDSSLSDLVRDVKAGREWPAIGQRLGGHFRPGAGFLVQAHDLDVEGRRRYRRGCPGRRSSKTILRHPAQLPARNSGRKRNRLRLLRRAREIKSPATDGTILYPVGNGLRSENPA